MKTLLILSLVLLGVSCGKDNKTYSHENVYATQYEQARTIQVGSPLEVHNILRNAMRYGNIGAYHNVRWHLFNGAYICTSIATSARSYKLIFN